MDHPNAIPRRHRNYLAILLNRAVFRLSRNWFPWFLVISGIYVGLPWLAPVAMRMGWEGIGRAIYFMYSFLCHQLPQRSFFLFGPSPSYPLATIQQVWGKTVDPVVLRQFIGASELGYKVAWSDRMVSLYTSIPIAAAAWWPFRRRLRSLPLWAFAFLALPIAVDGTSHVISDLAGIGQGFRDTNQWLAALTGYRFPPTYYAGDALGSFNSWMRLITGALFGMGVVWLAFPAILDFFQDAAEVIDAKFKRAGVPL